MSLYEHVFLARQDVSTQAVDALIAQYKTLIEGLGGKVTKIENWGLKSLAYRVKKNRKAHYALLNIDAPAPAIAELERQERLSEDVLRFLTAFEAHGRSGRSLRELWGDDDASAYLGCVIPDFPNFFVLYGPNQIGRAHV